MIDAESIRVFNAALTTICIVIASIMAWWTTRAGSIESQASRYAERVQLPFGSENIHAAVMRRTKSLALANGVAPLSALVVSLAFIATPFGADQMFIFVVVFPSLLVALTLASVIVSVQERLIDPPPAAARIARVHTMSAADYLGPIQRTLPWVLAVSAGLGLGWLVLATLSARQGPDAALAGASIVTALFAVFALITTPLLERLVLDRPQPATHSLELAWDDAYRADTLRALRQSSAVASWIVIALAIAAVTADDFPSSWAAFWVNMGLLVTSIVYRPTRLREGLRPAWLRVPTTSADPA